MRRRKGGGKGREGVGKGRERVGLCQGEVEREKIDVKRHVHIHIFFNRKQLARKKERMQGLYTVNHKMSTPYSLIPCL